MLAAEKSRPVLGAGPIFALPQATLEAERRRKMGMEFGQNGFYMPDYREEMSAQTRNLRQAFVQSSTLNLPAYFLDQVNRMTK